MPRRKGRDLKRRNARNRLLRYITRGGALVRDQTGLAFCKANRSGEAYPTALVERLIERGWSAGGVSYRLVPSSFTPGLWLLREPGDPE